MIQTVEEALGAIAQLDDPYLRAIREQGQQTWGLNEMRALLKELGDPQDAYPVIHVAGTKGKGSTCAFITQCLIESGLKVGLYTSPHLQDWRERIQINRQWIQPDELVELMSDFAPHLAEQPMTQFEATTALAFWHFARQKVDVAVIEVGLGGRLDATNVVKPLVSVITSISKDHTQLLGETLEEIASDKSAIIKQGRPVVIAPQHKAVNRVLHLRVKRQESKAIWIGKNWDYEVGEMRWNGSTIKIGAKKHRITIDVGIPGEVQCENAALALATIGLAEQEGLAVTRRGRMEGITNARWPGRLEVIQENPMIVLDGAHNPFSMRKLVHALHSIDKGSALKGGGLHVIFGCMADKEKEKMLSALVPVARQMYLVASEHPRAAAVADLLPLAEAEITHNKTRIEAVGDIASAVSKAQASMNPGDTLLVTGSLSIVGTVRGMFIQEPS